MKTKLYRSLVVIGLLPFFAGEVHAEVYSEDTSLKIRGLAEKILEKTVQELDPTDLPLLDDNESYIDNDAQSELKTIRSMVKNLGNLMIDNYLLAGEGALKNSQQFSDTKMRMLRDAHPQGLICLKGEVEIFNNEVFGNSFLSQPGSYDAVTRFSSSSPSLQSDSQKDIRGLAIKIDGGSFEHDLVTLSSAVFPADDAKEFSDLVKVVRLGGCLNEPLNLLSCIQDVGVPNPLRLARSAFRLLSLILSSEDSGLLEKKYFSVTPYKYEDSVTNEKVYFKFHVEPKNCDLTSAGEPNYALKKTGPDNYLADNVRGIVGEKEVCFDIFVTSLKSNIDRDLIETHSKTWENIASHVAVTNIGELRFAQNAEELDAVSCDNLNFSPAQTASDFTALGSINRARSVIYSKLSALRHEINDAIRREGW